MLRSGGTQRLTFIFSGKAQADWMKYCQNPKRNPLPWNTRTLIRTYSDIVPQAGNTSREAAMHVFENSAGNWICPYHCKHDRLFEYYDTTTHTRKGAEYKLYGVPYQGAKNSGSRAGKVLDAPEVDEYLHCGCLTEDALIAFFWFKSAEYASPTAKTPSGAQMTEGWCNQQLEARARGLVIETFLAFTGIESVDEMYTFDREGNRRSQSELVKLQIDKLKLQHINLKEEEKMDREKALADRKAAEKKATELEEGGALEWKRGPTPEALRSKKALTGPLTSKAPQKKEESEEETGVSDFYDEHDESTSQTGNMSSSVGGDPQTSSSEDGEEEEEDGEEEEEDEEEEELASETDASSSSDDEESETDSEDDSE